VRPCPLLPGGWLPTAPCSPPAARSSATPKPKHCARLPASLRAPLDGAIAETGLTALAPSSPGGPLSACCPAGCGPHRAPRAARRLAASRPAARPAPCPRARSRSSQRAARCLCHSTPARSLASRRPPAPCGPRACASSPKVAAPFAAAAKLSALRPSANRPPLIFVPAPAPCAAPQFHAHNNGPEHTTPHNTASTARASLPPACVHPPLPPAARALRAFETGQPLQLLPPTQPLPRGRLPQGVLPVPAPRAAPVCLRAPVWSPQQRTRTAGAAGPQNPLPRAPTPPACGPCGPRTTQCAHCCARHRPVYCRGRVRPQRAAARASNRKHAAPAAAAQPSTRNPSAPDLRASAAVAAERLSARPRVRAVITRAARAVCPSCHPNKSLSMVRSRARYECARPLDLLPVGAQWPW
jgi:hypothetical protein